jgi:streptomycin 6-kinase
MIRRSPAHVNRYCASLVMATRAWLAGMHASAERLLDQPLRARLVGRYGDDVQQWLDELPAVLTALAARWKLELVALIPRGSMSVVIRSLTAEGDAVVLKVCPDRDRLAQEADALERWSTTHMVEVHAADTSVGALLLEAIEPGTMLAEFDQYPGAEIAQLLQQLHTSGAPDATFPPVSARVSNLYGSLDRHRRLHPELTAVIPPDLFERGRRLAHHLANETSSTVLLHGDLTPVNVLDGGTARGLVAIDPAPCVGDPAFDAVDLLFWKADRVDTIRERARTLATNMDADADRLFSWAVAFACTIASELSERPNGFDARFDTAFALASMA